MAKVSGPLFSMTAAGTVGDGICFQKGPGGHRVTLKPVHRDLRAASQLAHRASYQSAVSYWKSLHVHEKEFYNFLGHQIQITGFNYCVGRCLEGLT